jgi:hypothetical protein
MVCRRYRPRQPRASPVWQVLREHWPAYLIRQEAGASAKHGPMPSHAPDAVAAFLRCGDLHAGFTRLRCPDCRHEYLLAFTCKQRGLCAACHQRRVLTEAPFIADEVCADVPHRHLVLTIPRLLRGHFIGKPAALGELALAARDALAAWLRDRTGRADGQPGLVMVVQTFGDFLLRHPHVHVIVTAGVFGRDGRFHLAPTDGWSELRELWRRAVLRRLNRAGILADWQTEHLLSWRHSGFTLDAGPAPLAAGDRAGRRRLAEYLLRAPFSLEKLTYNPTSGHILYRSDRHWRTKRNFEVFRAHDFITALLAHLPAKGVPSVRYYGWYSNKARGQRAKSPPTAAPGIAPAKPKSRRRRVRWRALIHEVWGADPLRCPLCPGLLRPVEWIETPDAIRAFLEPLGLYAVTTGPPGQGPPPPQMADLIDADTGESFPVGPRAPSPLELPRGKTDPLYHRRWMLPEVPDEGCQPDAKESFNQTGFELPPWREPRTDPRQVLLFADDAIQADPPDSEPVFAFGNSAAEADDDYIQPDATDDVGQ